LVRSGVTTVEVKTGYGLSVDHELRLLRLARAAGRRVGCEVLPTLLALHAVPPDSDRFDWLRAVVQELIPEAAREGARGCDAFLEKGAFDTDECRTALEAGAQAGLVCHLHADQLSASGGAQLAAELECASADHLERATRTRGSSFTAGRSCIAPRGRPLRAAAPKPPRACVPRPRRCRPLSACWTRSRAPCAGGSPPATRTSRARRPGRGFRRWPDGRRRWRRAQARDARRCRTLPGAGNPAPVGTAHGPLPNRPGSASAASGTRRR